MRRRKERCTGGNAGATGVFLQPLDDSMKYLHTCAGRSLIRPRPVPQPLSGEHKTQKRKNPAEGGAPGQLVLMKLDGLAAPNFIESGVRVKRKRVFSVNGIPLC